MPSSEREGQVQKNKPAELRGLLENVGGLMYLCPVNHTDLFGWKGRYESVLKTRIRSIQSRSGMHSLRCRVMQERIHQVIWT